MIFLLSIPAALGASLMVSTLSANNSVTATNMSLLADEFPNCVNSTRYTEWGEGLLPTSCAATVTNVRNEIQANRRLFIDYGFYSKKNPPRRMPLHGWPLPQGAATGKCALSSFPNLHWEANT